MREFSEPVLSVVGEPTSPPAADVCRPVLPGVHRTTTDPPLDPPQTNPRCVFLRTSLSTFTSEQKAVIGMPDANSRCPPPTHGDASSVHSTDPERQAGRQQLSGSGKPGWPIRRAWPAGRRIRNQSAQMQTSPPNTAVRPPILFNAATLNLPSIDLSVWRPAGCETKK